jgi:hypothetical protein
LLHKLKYFLLLALSIHPTVAQTQINPYYIPGDPRNLLSLEQSTFDDPMRLQILDFRPFIPAWPEQGIAIQTQGQSFFYYNDNAPNLENTAEMWVGKGSTFFSSVQLSMSHRYVYLSFEPYFQYSSNQKFTFYHTSQDPDNYGALVRKFHVLNDGPGRGEGVVRELRLREAQLYLHWKGLGGGISNSGMWWGPGYHTSLNMTTNTTGIPRLVLGTLKEQRFKQFGFTGQYVFSKLNENVSEPYFTAIFGSLTYYSTPVITLGGSRTFLSGGNLIERPIAWEDAALLPFQAFRKEKLYDEGTGTNPSDRTDQTLSLFISMLFPESKLKIFLEYGANDHRWDWYDLRAEPDHSGASVFGFRKYELFGNPDLLMGFEYANLMKSPYYPQRATPDWYGRPFFDYSVYDGRRYAAHSGSDSDDMLFYLGYNNEHNGLTVAFNYERHGKIYSNLLLEYSGAGRFPEDKLELRLDYWKETSYGKLYVYYEYEFTENLGSPPQGVFPRVDNPERKANVLGLGFQSNLFSF